RGAARAGFSGLRTRILGRLQLSGLLGCQLAGALGERSRLFGNLRGGRLLGLELELKLAAACAGAVEFGMGVGSFALEAFELPGELAAAGLLLRLLLRKGGGLRQRLQSGLASGLELVLNGRNCGLGLGQCGAG